MTRVYVCILFCPPGKAVPYEGVKDSDLKAKFKKLELDYKAIPERAYVQSFVYLFVCLFVWMDGCVYVGVGSFGLGFGYVLLWCFV